MTATSAAAPATERQAGPAWQTPSPWERLTRAPSFRNASALYIFVLLFVVFSLWEPATFLTSQTWRLLLDNQAITGMVAIALVVPLSAGVVDLAVGSEVGMGAILVAWLLARHGLPIPLAIGLTIVAGIAIGVATSLLIVRARIGSFIATLGMSSVLLAVIDWLSGSQQILNLGSGFQAIATGTLFGITYPVYVLALISLLVWYFLERTRSGRRVYATGGNAEAARLAGVRTSRRHPALRGQLRCHHRRRGDTRKRATGDRRPDHLRFLPASGIRRCLPGLDSVSGRPFQRAGHAGRGRRPGRRSSRS